MSEAISVCHGAFGRAGLYRLDKPLITHAHREGHLIFHIDGSFSNVVINNKSLDVDSHQAVAVSPLEPHSFDIKSPEASVVLVLYIKPLWFLKSSNSAHFNLRFGCSEIQRTHAIDDLVRRFTELLADSLPAGHIDDLLFNLGKHCYDQSWESAAQPGSDMSIDPAFTDYRISRSLGLMHECISAEVELEAVARSVGLSRPHFFKLFKKQMGITPNVYMNTLRSERAIEELINTDKTVTNIASQLGYSSQASFTRFFSSNVGIAPSEYRRFADRP